MPLRDFKMADSGDLVLEGGDLSTILDGPTDDELTESVRQRAIMRLRTNRGEWYQNQYYGVPWFGQILGSKTPRQTGAIVASILADVQGVRNIAILAENETSPRGYTIALEIKTSDSITTTIPLPVNA